MIFFEFNVIASEKKNHNPTTILALLYLKNNVIIKETLQRQCYSKKITIDNNEKKKNQVYVIS